MSKEWFVIEDTAKWMVFGKPKPTGYIPRDVVEDELGIPCGDGPTWFTREQSEAMRAHPKWTNENPTDQHPGPPNTDDV